MADDKKKDNAAPSGLAPNRTNNNTRRVSAIITKKGNPEDYYVKMRVFRWRALMLWATVALLSFFEAGLIFNVMLYDISWVTILTPLIIISSIVLLFPPTEEWIYRPWQAEAQRVERHFYDV